MKRIAYLVAAGMLTIVATTQAATFRFDTDPFEGTDAVGNGVRDIIGNELFIENFSIENDVFSFDPAVFGVNEVSLVNDVVENIPATGVNFVVLQTTTDPDNPGGAFGAGTAARLISERITTPGAGFFIYFNSNLNMPRLVFSTDLSENTSDLKILARMINLTGQPESLASFSEANFNVNAVPEPSSMWLTAAGAMSVFGFALRRRKAKQ